MKKVPAQQHQFPQIEVPPPPSQPRQLAALSNWRTTIEACRDGSCRPRTRGFSRLVWLLSIPWLVLAAVADAAITPPDPSPPPFTAKELAQGFREHVILARPHAARQALAEDQETRAGIRIRRSFERLRNLRVLELPSSDSADAAIARLRASGAYEFVEPDYIRHIAVEPNDPQFGALWGMKNPGPGTDGGMIGGIAASGAWDIIHDAPEVVVAVVDTGINVNHLDLAGNIWVNSHPTRGDINGANFVGGRGAIVSGNPADDNGHGTHVAGTIGAVGNNGRDVAGVAWRVKLMALKVFPATGSGSTSDIVGAIHYAIEHGAHIINASYGALSNTSFSQAELSAIAAARSAGIIFVAAAGNSAANMDVSRFYPASHALDNIVTVGNSTRRDELSLSTNYGSAVDLFAPGSEIISLRHSSNTGTVTFSGTSMAAPHVSGALALLRARFPNDSYRQLINRLLRGAEPSVNPEPNYSFVGKSQTGGRLNVLRALQTEADADGNRPFNDNFSRRPRFTSDNLALRASNTGATREFGEPNHASALAGASLWWEWVAPADANVSIVTTGSGYDTVLSVYTGTVLSSLAPVAANDNDGSSLTSRVSFQAQAGVTYQIAVDGRNGASGLTLLRLGTTPANDAFAAAVTLSGESLQITASNANTSRESGEPKILNFNGGTSLWYRWTAPRSGRFQVAAVSDDFDPLLAVYTGTSLTSLNLVDANDNSGSLSSGSLCTIEALQGTTYMITVDSRDVSAVGNFNLSITDSRWQAAVGDAITGAPAVAPDGTIYFGSTDGSLYAVSPAGTIKWSVATGGLIDTCSPAIAPDGTVYIGSNDGQLYAVAPNGTQQWTRTLAVPASNSPALAADGTIYIKAGDGFLYALDPASGTEKWRFNVNAPTSYASPAIAADGTIYQGSENGTLYAINPNGTQKWAFSHQQGSDIYTVPAIDASGNLYFSVLNTGDLFSLTPAGSLRWIYEGASIASSSSACLSADGGTVYYGGYDRKLHAVNTATGLARWTYPLEDEVRASSPAIDAHGVVYIGCYDGRLYAINADGTLARTFDTGDWIRSSPVISGTTLYVGSNDAKLYAFDIGSAAGTGPWPQYRNNARRTGRALPAVSFTSQPASQSPLAGGSVTFTAAATGEPVPTYQWQYNGTDVTGATGSSLTIPNLEPAQAGLYTVVASSGTATVSAPAVLGVQLDDSTRRAGAGAETPDIQHPNTRFYDQILLQGTGVTTRADAGQVVRVSFIDLTDDIVQVEFSGAGTLTVVLDAASGPATPVNYEQPSVSYMKGHASIVVTGADETTYLTVFSVGRLTAHDPESDQNGFDFMKPISETNVPANNRSPLFVGHGSTEYDGMADLGFVAILSENGRFGGLFTANASYFGHKGITGVYAPGVEFTGPVYLGNLSAFDDGTPMLVFGSAPQTSIHGGDLFQDNHRAVQVRGITQLRFVDGLDSHARPQPAQQNRARLEQDGADVTAQIAVDPAP